MVLRNRIWHREKYPGCKRSLPPSAAPQKQSRGLQPRLGYLVARANCFALSWDEADACRSLACGVAAVRGFGSRRGCTGHSLCIGDKLLSRLRPLKKRCWVWSCWCPAKHLVPSLGESDHGPAAQR